MKIDSEVLKAWLKEEFKYTLENKFPNDAYYNLALQIFQNKIAELEEAQKIKNDEDFKRKIGKFIRRV